MMDLKVQKNQYFRSNSKNSDDNTTLNRVIEYEPNNLNFIDIKNVRKLNIRNIRARILKSDLSQVKLKGLTTITVLLN